MKKIVMILFAVATCACEPAELPTPTPPAAGEHTTNDFDLDKGTMDYGEASDGAEGFGVNDFGNSQTM